MGCGKPERHTDHLHVSMNQRDEIEARVRSGETIREWVYWCYIHKSTADDFQNCLRSLLAGGGLGECWIRKATADVKQMSS